MSEFLRATIVHKYNYVTPVHVASIIRRSQRACQHGAYLECVTLYAEVGPLVQEFARIHDMPELADPDVFYRYVVDSKARNSKLR